MATASIVGLHEPCAAVIAQVADGGDDAVGMLVPLKRTAETASYDPYPDFLGGGVYGQSGLSGQGQGCQGQGAAFHELASRAGRLRWMSLTAGCPRDDGLLVSGIVVHYLLLPD